MPADADVAIHANLTPPPKKIIFMSSLFGTKPNPIRKDAHMTILLINIVSCIESIVPFFF